MTADELLRLPRDETRRELVRGEPRTAPLAGFEHGRLTGRWSRSLGTFVEAYGLGDVVPGDVGFRLRTDPDTVRAPDVAFVSAERVRAIGRVASYWPGAPDLVVEVISPNDLYTDVDDKVAEWLEDGARLVFVVNPRRRTVAVHRPDRPLRVLTIDDLLDGEDVVPGWTLPCASCSTRRGHRPDGAAPGGAYLIHAAPGGARSRPTPVAPRAPA